MSAADLNTYNFGERQPDASDFILASAIAVELDAAPDNRDDDTPNRKLANTIRELVAACAAGNGGRGAPFSNETRLMASIRVAIRRLQRLRKHEAAHVRP